MHFEDGKCALCGKKLGQFAELDDFNKAGRPFLCSQKCDDVTGHVSEYDLKIKTPPDGDEESINSVMYGGYNKFYEVFQAQEISRVESDKKMIEFWRQDFRREWQKLKTRADEEAFEERIALEMAKPKMPDEVPYNIRSAHTHVVAGSGSGKTNLLTRKFMTDVFDVRQPSIIVIDGKGTWAPILQRFACFAPGQKHSDRLVIINPQDKKHPPALNMFSVHEALAGGIAENLAYIFGARDYELSAKQRTAFTYAAQLVFSMEKPTIETLIALMQDSVIQDKEKKGGIPPTSPFLDAVNKQSRINQRFFRELFYHPTEFAETKRQIQNRIYDLLGCPAFAAMFMQEENRLNMHDVMQTGKILIVDASEGAVGKIAASTFGRYIISLAFSTATARIGIPRSEWRPTFMYIDEAHMFADEERTEPILQQAREFNLGAILAHQKLADLITPKLRATFAGNTSSKYCSDASYDDARVMAQEMNSDTDFVFSHKKKDEHGNFAVYIRGVTDTAVSYRFPLGTMENTPKMTDAQYAQLMARNNALMSPPPRARTETPPPIPQPVPPPIPPAQPSTRSITPPPKPDNGPEEW